VSFTAVVMAAGQGTRMKSKTPKVLHDLCGRPMLHWPALAARAAGAAKLVVVGGADGALEGQLPEAAVLAVQPVANGTGGAVVAAAHEIGPDDTVVVINGDETLVDAGALRGLVAAHTAAQAAITVATVVLDDPGSYGRVIREADGSLARIVETKADGDATDAERAVKEINVGVYVFAAAPLLAALPQLSSHNAQGELYLTDLLELLRAAGHTVHAHDLQDPNLLVGVNDRAELARVRAVLQRRILDAHMKNGVTIVNPGATTIDAAVSIGQDTTIEPGCVLRGATTIGADATIGPGSTLTDTTVGDASKLVHTYANQAMVHAGVAVGPYAYLRPGTVLRDRAKIGTFVEVKNSDIGEGSKVPHLSYIGDADVGSDSNLGAATITANYDGKNKHRTTIGSRVKSSVDVSFVAPVTVGDDAYTGAGSVITDDVPPGALGMARARQTNIEGYAARRAAEPPSES
jgi:bifunctional UDP-N-acetylglucosamine pyrophosphorylase/glucosamine-1-phosphate N-acetyltransferase